MVRIEAEMPLYRRRHFDTLPFVGLAVGNRCDEQLDSISDDLAGDNDHHGSVFQPLFLTPVRLIGPQIGVAENVTRLGRLP